MAECKYCKAQITWTENNGKNVPLNLDNSQHRCKSNNTQPQTTVSQNDDITQLVKLFEKVLRSK